MKTGFCVVIPVYNHPDTIADTVAEVRSAGFPVILVDDGSEPVCAGVLDRLTEGDEAVHLRRLQVNGGKGRAVKSGLLMARELGFAHALQIDADGQHDPQDIPRLVRLSRQHPDAIISGMPAYDDSVPRVRYYSRYLTHVWVWINTLSLEVRDSMCGFRAYPLQPVCELIGREYLGDRMDFDTEVLVRWVWQGGRVFQFSTRVRYPRDGISHFRGFEDNWLITRMHTRLFFGMLRRLPRLLARRLRRREVSS
ncbi:glycosyltransferase family 2 protein [Marinobacter oulmenensis]|uniref:Glycosyltransferase involved in cell wall biosynthesis n=1 Tax=Marinobacter oulmenensis TaxID=643747 RepID=A0A840UHH7_9GAMM|nr:glycosyltransferase family 2 protein [Marinobacter oulmenensis]MBB5320258.1 glycosyltransferase involved in cell wall biosynthesis [Marinobacter oulmenensis]